MSAPHVSVQPPVQLSSIDVPDRCNDDQITEQRADILKQLANLHRLLDEVQPLGILAILQDIGDLEGEVFVASQFELPGVREKLRRLMGQLQRTGIITAERFERFFIEPRQPLQNSSNSVEEVRPIFLE